MFESVDRDRFQSSTWFLLHWLRMIGEKRSGIYEERPNSRSPPDDTFPNQKRWNETSMVFEFSVGWHNMEDMRSRCERSIFPPEEERGRPWNFLIWKSVDNEDSETLSEAESLFINLSETKRGNCRERLLMTLVGCIVAGMIRHPEHATTFVQALVDSGLLPDLLTICVNVLRTMNIPITLSLVFFRDNYPECSDSSSLSTAKPGPQQFQKLSEEKRLTRDLCLTHHDKTHNHPTICQIQRRRCKTLLRVPDVFADNWKVQFLHMPSQTNRGRWIGFSTMRCLSTPPNVRLMHFSAFCIFSSTIHFSNRSRMPSQN